MDLPKSLKVNKFPVRLDYRLNCKASNVIYLAVCVHCEPIQFYFGQTSTAVHTRMDGHRSSFNDIEKFENSALSNHVFHEHLDRWDDKLANFRLGIVKEVSPRLLDRTEDFYIYSTKAETQSLNRIKVRR